MKTILHIANGKNGRYTLSDESFLEIEDGLVVATNIDGFKEVVIRLEPGGVVIIQEE